MSEAKGHQMNNKVEELSDRLFEIVARHLDDVSGWGGAEPEIIALIADAWDKGFAEGVIDQERYHVTGDPRSGHRAVNPYRAQGEEPN